MQPSSLSGVLHPAAKEVLRVLIHDRFSHPARLFADCLSKPTIVFGTTRSFRMILIDSESTIVVPILVHNHRRI